MDIIDLFFLSIASLFPPSFSFLLVLSVFVCCTEVLVHLQASKKITDAKLAKDFQVVLKEFQKAQRLAAEMIVKQ